MSDNQMKNKELTTFPTLWFHDHRSFNMTKIGWYCGCCGKCVSPGAYYSEFHKAHRFCGGVVALARLCVVCVFVPAAVLLWLVAFSAIKLLQLLQTTAKPIDSLGRQPVKYLKDRNATITSSEDLP